MIILPASPPFSLPSVVRSHGWIQLAPFREDEVTGGFSYIAHLESGKVIDLRVQAAPGGVSIEIDADLTAAEARTVREVVTWMLDLNQDFSTFYDLARQEPKLARAAERAQGRILRSPTLFEDVIRTIHNQYLVGCNHPHEQQPGATVWLAIASRCDAPRFPHPWSACGLK